MDSPDRIIEIPNDPVLHRPDTVVVHLPAGQLYHRYPSASSAAGTRRKATAFACWTMFIIIILILSFLIFVFVIYIALRPKSPKFSISDFIIHQSNQSHPGKCKLWLSADNPNAHTGLFVKHGGGGFAALYLLNRREIAKGLPPAVYLRKSHVTPLAVLLEGLDHRARREIWAEEMRFEMDVKVRVQLWLLKAWDMKMDVRCTFRASSHLVNTSHVLSQICRDKIKLK